MRGNMFESSDAIDQVLENNRKWRESKVSQDPEFFARNYEHQHPEFLWIGCADSRVPAAMVMGLEPGDVFVQRNVGNQALHTDMNVMSCIEYAVNALKVKHIVLCGHYNCGAVKGALKMCPTTPGVVNCWIKDIRECRNQHSTTLKCIPEDKQVDRLVELNVLRQTFHVATSPVVQAAWKNGQPLNVYGCVYNIKDGSLNKLVGPINADADASYEDGNVVVRDKKSNSLKVMPSWAGNDDKHAVEKLAHTVNVVNKISEHKGWAAGASGH